MPKTQKVAKSAVQGIFGVSDSELFNDVRCDLGTRLIPLSGKQARRTTIAPLCANRSQRGLRYFSVENSGRAAERSVSCGRRHVVEWLVCIYIIFTMMRRTYLRRESRNAAFRIAPDWSTIEVLGHNIICCTSLRTKCHSVHAHAVTGAEVEE